MKRIVSICCFWLRKFFLSSWLKCPGPWTHHKREFLNRLPREDCVTFTWKSTCTASSLCKLIFTDINWKRLLPCRKKIIKKLMWYVSNCIYNYSLYKHSRHLLLFSVVSLLPHLSLPTWYSDCVNWVINTTRKITFKCCSMSAALWSVLLPCGLPLRQHPGCPNLCLSGGKSCRQPPLQGFRGKKLTLN